MMPPVKTAAELAYSVLACFFFWGACLSNQRPLIRRKIIKLNGSVTRRLKSARNCCYDAKDLKLATPTESLLPPSNICDAATGRLPSEEAKPSPPERRRRRWWLVI